MDDTTNHPNGDASTRSVPDRAGENVTPAERRARAVRRAWHVRAAREWDHEEWWRLRQAEKRGDA
ncbi:hypothetical protein [Embleya sp. NPDC059237]|uniref:hypothetical protein n=1 Tax=Embleya sp. NPDC059237 TaxID=3346784 RepID=UPI0036B2AEF1